MIGTVIQLDTKLEANCNSKFNTDHGERRRLREICSKWNRPKPKSARRLGTSQPDRAGGGTPARSGCEVPNLRADFRLRSIPFRADLPKRSPFSVIGIEFAVAIGFEFGVQLNHRRDRRFFSFRSSSLSAL